MRSYEDATSRPHGYLMLHLKPTTSDQDRLKTNILPGKITKFIRKQSYRQPPLVNTMYDAEQRMKEIMEVPQLSAVEKSKLYSDQLNQFLTFKNKMAHSSPGIPETSAQSIPQAPAEMPQLNESVVLNLVSLRHHQQKRNDQNSSATFSTIGSTQKRERIMNVLY